MEALPTKIAISINTKRRNHRIQKISLIDKDSAI
jgi:hypothetical protein